MKDFEFITIVAKSWIAEMPHCMACLHIFISVIQIFAPMSKLSANLDC